MIRRPPRIQATTCGSPSRYGAFILYQTRTSDGSAVNYSDEPLSA
jgi:hypothetical protein